MEMISLSDIERAEFNEQLVIVSQSEEDVLTDDFDLDKKVNYHLVAPTDAWLRERFLYGSSCKEEAKAYEDAIVSKFLGIDQLMLMNLNRIIFIKSQSDVEEVCDTLGFDADYEYPDIVAFEEDGSPVEGASVGCYWGIANSIIINLAAIKQTLDEMEQEAKDTGDLGFSRAAEEGIGIVVTALHGIRNLGLNNPFVNETDYPDELALDSNVEAWAREMYETV